MLSSYLHLRISWTRDASKKLVRVDGQRVLEVVLLERNDSVFSSLPGGFIQVKETPTQTARRRFADEALGINVVCSAVY